MPAAPLTAQVVATVSRAVNALRSSYGRKQTPDVDTLTCDVPASVDLIGRHNDSYAVRGSSCGHEESLVRNDTAASWQGRNVAAVLPR